LNLTAQNLLLCLVFIAILMIMVRGFLLLIDRYNFILVILYFVFVFPLAVIHMILIGIFGKFKNDYE